MSRFELDASEMDRLQRTMAVYEGDVESAINDVLHNDASQILQQEITRLMPVSGRHWAGKKGSAKSSGSLRDEKSNLAITVKAKKAYSYLYFPDDGTDTRRHAGNQRFFERGAENKQSQIIDRCIGRLMGGF